VTISSTVDVGTRVDVYLPAIHERTQQAVDGDGCDAATAAACARRAQILLVEADPAVRDAVRGVLDRAGYRVVAADDAAQALELVTGSGTAYDLLLTDVIMPGMWGDELAKRARQCAPHLLVLFMSGYGERFLRRGRAPAPGPVLMKPVADEALLREVASLLDSRPSSNERPTQSPPSPAENSDRSNGEAEGPPMPTQGALDEQRI
jgi:CheY-like chemotaxis protein